jgi:hypothetical protein
MNTEYRSAVPGLRVPPTAGWWGQSGGMLGALQVHGDGGVLGIRVSLNGQSCLHAPLCHPVGIVVPLVVESEGADEHPAIATAQTINTSAPSFLRITAHTLPPPVLPTAPKQPERDSY